MTFSARATCPCCGASDARTVFSCRYTHPPVVDYLRLYYRRFDETPLADAVYQAEQCTACGCCFQRYVPDDALLAEIYGKWLVPDDPTAYAEKILSFASSIHSHPRFSKAAHEFFALAAWLGKRAGDDPLKVFDFGMGWGEWLRVARHHGATVVGTELDPFRREIATRHGITVCSDAEWPTMRFDIIHTEQVFEHLPDPLATLEKLASALTATGVIFVSVPRADDLVARFADAGNWRSDRPSPKPYHGVEPNRLHALQPLEHLSCYTPLALKRLGARAGLVPARLPFRHRYAFLLRRGLHWRDPRWALKSLLRPIYETFRRDNQVMLFHKAPH